MADDNDKDDDKTKEKDKYEDDKKDKGKDDDKKPCRPGSFWIGWLYLAAILIIIVLVWTVYADKRSIENKLLITLVLIIVTAVAVMIMRKLHAACKKTSVWIVFLVFLIGSALLLFII